MFETNKDRLYEGISRGEARVWIRINDILKRHKDDEPHAVLTAIKIICEYEINKNPRCLDEMRGFELIKQKDL